ncbi:hypothetical protein BDW02DRAFT_596737 [Decorospora gaudefroyi]|uniref:Uncharacterized protein n=1 Tax=Decorospora gaudefroyi TaxID=184978 RepID=A0A6A5KQY5_9PLEO|nr:hypothetical protein BDW02DRAFT_596737 [Decorospora gaudefroyi]
MSPSAISLLLTALFLSLNPTLSTPTAQPTSQPQIPFTSSTWKLYAWDTAACDEEDTATATVTAHGPNQHDDRCAQDEIKEFLFYNLEAQYRICLFEDLYCGTLLDRVKPELYCLDAEKRVQSWRVRSKNDDCVDGRED